MRGRTSDKARLARWHEYTLYAVVAALSLSGMAWLVLHYLLARRGELGPLPHPYEGAALAVHGAVAMVSLFFIGSLLITHMLRAWSARRNRWSGVMIGGISAVLTLTGYGLYYVADDGVRDWIGLSHWVIGLAMPIALIWHVILGRRLSQVSTRLDRAKPLGHRTRHAHRAHLAGHSG